MSDAPFDDPWPRSAERRGSASSNSTRRHRPLLSSPDERREGLVAPALYYAREDGEVREYILRLETTHIGSAADNHVIIDGARSSHAKLRLERDRIALIDLDTGETYLNDERVAEAVLRPGDTLRLGQASISVAMKVLAPDAIEEPLWDARAALGLDAAPGPDEESGAPPPAGGDGAWGVTGTLSRLRAYMDALDPEAGFEAFLDTVVSGLVELVQAKRAVCILFEEDGENPIFSVERWADPRDQDEDGEDTQAIVDEKVVAEAVRGDRVVMRALPPTIDEPEARQVYSVRVRWRRHTVGLLYCERGSAEDQAAVAELCAIAARVLAHPIRNLLGLGGA